MVTICTVGDMFKPPEVVIRMSRGRGRSINRTEELVVRGGDPTSRLKEKEVTRRLGNLPLERKGWILKDGDKVESEGRGCAWFGALSKNRGAVARGRGGRSAGGREKGVRTERIGSELVYLNEGPGYWKNRGGLKGRSLRKKK